MSTTNKPPIGVMPRRVWEEQRISALAESIVRFMRPVHPSVPTVFDLSHVRDWAAEIVELCERHGGQEHAARASDASKDGGGSDRRRLEALERWLKGDTYRMVYFSTRGVVVAGSDSIGDDDMEAPTLAALADKIMEKEAKP